MCRYRSKGVCLWSGAANPTSSCTITDAFCTSGAEGRISTAVSYYVGPLHVCHPSPAIGSQYVHLASSSAAAHLHSEGHRHLHPYVALITHRGVLGASDMSSLHQSYTVQPRHTLQTCQWARHVITRIASILVNSLSALIVLVWTHGPNDQTLRLQLLCILNSWETDDGIGTHVLRTHLLGLSFDAVPSQMRVCMQEFSICIYVGASTFVWTSLGTSPREVGQLSSWWRRRNEGSGVRSFLC